jgi:hypothetical protein
MKMIETIDLNGKTEGPLLSELLLQAGAIQRFQNGCGARLLAVGGQPFGYT